MLISKENTGKSKYTLEFHSLRAPPWKSPRREGKVEDETSTTLREGSNEGEGSPTCPAFTAFVYPLRGERSTIVKLVKTAFNGLDFIRSFLETTLLPKPLMIADNKRHI